jgi:tape measure domain-containing protein
MASATVAKLNILLTASTGVLAGDLSKAGRMLSGFSGKVAGGGAAGGAGGMLAGLATKINPVMAGLAGLAALGAGATWATKLASDAEQLKTSFDVMLGSAEKSKAMLADIKQLALDAPTFGTQDLSQNAQTLMQFGVEGEKIVPILRTLGDVSMGDKERMERLTLAFGQMSAAGRLMGQDLLQMINAGFNPLQEISKLTGRSMADLKKDMEAGGISSEMVTEAFKSATSEGGRFFGMMKAQGGTFAGQWAKLIENLQQAFLPAGKLILGMLTEVLKVANAALESWNKFWGNTPQAKGAKNLGAVDKSVFDGLGKDPREAEKAADDAKRAIEQLQQQGNALAQSLRTPFEIIHDNVAEAHRLLEAGVISADTYSRALGKAREDLAAQARSAREIREQLSQQMGGPVAALQFGTQAALSGVNAANREMKLQLETQKAIVAEQKATNERLKKIEAAVKNSKPVNVQEVTL